jgi:hypothetical protein
MAWQLCNEPRPFARDIHTKEMFAQWIARAAALINTHIEFRARQGALYTAKENGDFVGLHIGALRNKLIRVI